MAMMVRVVAGLASWGTALSTASMLGDCCGGEDGAGADGEGDALLLPMVSRISIQAPLGFMIWTPPSTTATVFAGTGFASGRLEWSIHCAQ